MGDGAQPLRMYFPGRETPAAPAIEQDREFGGSFELIIQKENL